MANVIEKKKIEKTVLFFNGNVPLLLIVIFFSIKFSAFNLSKNKVKIKNYFDNEEGQEIVREGGGKESAS